MCEKLCKGRHQPLLLLYMNPRTQAVDVTSAPKERTMAPGYEWKNDGTTDFMKLYAKVAVKTLAVYLVKA